LGFGFEVDEAFMLLIRLLGRMSVQLQRGEHLSLDPVEWADPEAMGLVGMPEIP